MCCYNRTNCFVHFFAPTKKKQLEYDDGDGDGEQSHEDYHNYSSSSDQNPTPTKRKYENDIGNDETDHPKDGESSTSSEKVPKKKRRKEFLNLNATFMAGVQGVQLVTDQVIAPDILIAVQQIQTSVF